MDTSDEQTTTETAPTTDSFGSLFSHQTSHRTPDPDPGDSAAQPPAAPAFGLIFQPPDLSDVPPPKSRRRKDDPAADDGDQQGSEQGDRDSGEGNRRKSPRREQPQSTSEDSEDSESSAPSKDSSGDSNDNDNDNDTDTDDDSEDGEGRGRRRRRRGGKGRRGRNGEDTSANDSDSGEDEESADTKRSSTSSRKSSRTTRAAGQGADSNDGDKSSDSDSSRDDDSGDDEGSTKRRRRRRRGEEGSARAARSEVSGVKGSTRLEAKRQRRREGREAGRRRTIISEAEFLARRESVERTMIVRGLPDRTQIGVLEDGVLSEHYVSRATQTTTVGNVYLGRVQNVLPSMEAAFVDIGKGRNAVLYAGEVNWDAAGLDNAPKRIEYALKSGESVLVQVTKDPIGHKGARLTSQVSLPGRYLVYVPGGSMTGISRKLPDTERTRLKKILRDIVPEDAGVIVRTAAEGATENELRADVERLTKTWERIEAKAKTANAPAVLHSEAEMTTRVIRDIFNEDITSLVVSGDDAWEEVSSYVSSVAPDLSDRVQRWEPQDGGADDIFSHYRVHEALAKALDRKVWLASGGSLVIDRTEAMTVVDVNTGKFVGSGGDLEETVTKNNLEAAEEIARQLRLRDIGGIIVIDFIDMVLEANRDLVIRRLLECLGRDRTKHQVAEVTSLGLVQMTRKRVGSGLLEVFSENCTHCAGRGVITHSEPVDKSTGGADQNQGQSRRGNRSRGGSTGSGGSSSNAGSNGGGKKNGTASLPTPNPNGPTPAQIAAAAHAAAVQAVANGVEKATDEPDSETEKTPTGSAGGSTTSVEAADTTDAPQADLPPAAPVRKPRSRRAKSAVTAPAGAPPVSAEPAPAGEPSAPITVTAAEAASSDTFEQSAPVASGTASPERGTDTDSDTDTAAPAARRRRRGRVVAPAGPPSAAE